MIPATEILPDRPWKLFKSRLPDSFDEFCSYIAAGGHMAAFCKERGISYTTILKWVALDPSKSEMYARAREDRSDFLFDEIVAISDETPVVARYQDNEMVLVLDAAAVSRNRLRVDARKWAASKLKPRVYGNKLVVERTMTLKSFSDEELLRRLGAFGIHLTSIVPMPA